MRRLFFSIIVFIAIACQTEPEQIKPTLAPILEAVYASANIKPVNVYTVYSAVGGIIEAKMIQEGDQVKEGTTLFKIKNTSSRLNVENAQLNYDLTKAQYDGRATVLRELEKQIEIARLKLENDSMMYFKQKRLWDQDIGTENALESRELAYQVAQREIKALNNQYQRIQTDLANQLKISKNQINKAQASNDDFIVESKLLGIVYEVKKEVGESVLPQEPLAIIGSEDAFIVELLVDEQDIARISLGQKTLITLEAYPDQVFEAKITKIAPKMDTRTQTFLVESEFIESPSQLYMGLSGEANIVTKEKKQALVIPLAYLMEGSKVLTPDGEIAVKTGLRSLDRVEILSPIDTATVLFKPEQL